MMRNEVDDAVIAAWAAKNLSARLHAAEVAKILNCTTEDVTVLTSAGKLRPLGKPRPNSVKLFSAIELLSLLADREWLDDATKTIGQFWRRKNERRKAREGGTTGRALPQRAEPGASIELARLSV